MADIIVAILENTLSDQSKTFDVVVRDGSIAKSIKVPAISEKDAELLAEKLTNAFNEHTVFTSERR